MHWEGEQDMKRVMLTSVLSPLREPSRMLWV